MTEIKKIIKDHRIMVIVLTLAIVFYYAGQFALKPVTKKIISAKDELARLNTEKSNLIKEVEMIKGKEEELKEKEKRLTEYFILKSKIGNISNHSKFFKDITNFDKVSFISLKPTKKEKISHYIKMELTLNISGSYQDLDNYIKYLDGLPYIISVKKLDFSKTSGKNINISMVIETVGR